MMDELSHIGKIEKAFDVSILAHIGCELSYFDILELRGYIKELESYIDELKADNKQLTTEHERLTAELTAERERNRWIPAGERLPENEDNVLVFCDMEMIVAYCNRPTFVKTMWFDALENGYLKSVTHWRPIVPPEVE